MKSRSIAELKTSVLQKRKRNRSGFGLNFGIDLWQERSVVLSYTKIVYYLLDGTERGYIPVTTSTVVTDIPEMDGRKHVLKVNTGGEELILSCKSREEKLEWIKAITDVTSSVLTEMKRSSLGIAGVNKLRTNSVETEFLNIERNRGVTPPPTTTLDISLQYSPINQLSHVNIDKPCRCMKKFSMDAVYQESYIWINSSKQEFYYSTSMDNTSNNKEIFIIHIYQHIKSIAINAIPHVTQPNFTIYLQAYIPTLDNTRTITNNTVHQTSYIDIYMEDINVCNAFVSIIKGIIHA